MGDPIPVKQAKRGDLVMTEDDGGTLGVCVGAKVMIPARPSGLVSVPLSNGLAAWRVE
jgi:hypothetical protein